MRLLSWNVNGIRAIDKKGFKEFLEKDDPDVLCVQEIKIHEPHPMDLHGYEQVWFSAKKKGYSGTAIFSKIKPLSVKQGIGIEEYDDEGRALTLEFEKFYLVNVYVPNAQHGLPRLPFRMAWDAALLKYIQSLEKSKPVVLCGDMNVAHKEIDLKNPGPNRGNPGFTDEERAGMDNYIAAEFIDTFREFNKKPNQYSWWSYRMNARARNIGWRIDYFLISKALRKNLEDAFIMQEIMGSDHCPIGIELS